MLAKAAALLSALCLILGFSLGFLALTSPSALASPPAGCTLNATSGNYECTADQGGNSTCVADATLTPPAAYACSGPPYRFPASATISQPDPADTYVGNSVVLAVDSPNSGPVTFALDRSSTGCDVDPSSGTVTFTSNGECTVTATQDGDGLYDSTFTSTAPMSVSDPPPSAPLPATLTLAAPSADQLVVGNSALTLLTTSDNTNLVVYTSSSPSVCIADASTTIDLVAPGDCTVTGAQDPDATYDATTSEPFTVPVRQPATLVLYPPSDTPVVGDSLLLTTDTLNTSPVVLQSLTPDVCTANPEGLSLIAAGTCTLTASQVDDGTYQATQSDPVSFPVLDTTTLVIDPPSASDAVVGGSPTLATATANTSPIEFASETPDVCTVDARGTVTLLAASSCTISGAQPSDGTYEATSSSVTFAISPQPQTVSFTSTAPTDATVGTGSYTPTAVGTDGGTPVAITLDPTSVGCGIAAGSVTYTSPGVCVLDADQPGDSNHLAATTAQQSFTVSAPILASPSPSLDPIAVPSPVASPVPAPDSSPAPVVPSPVATATPTQSAPPAPSSSPQPSRSPSPSPRPSPSPSPSPLRSASPSPSPSPAATPDAPESSAPEPAPTADAPSNDPRQLDPLIELATVEPSPSESPLASPDVTSSPPPSTEAAGTGTGPAKPAPSGAPLPGPGAEFRARLHLMSSIAASLHRPDQIEVSFRTIGTNLLLVILMIVLLGTPSELINDAWMSHYDEITGWFPSRMSDWLRRHTTDPKLPTPPPAAHSPVATPRRIAILAAFAFVSAMIYGFLDPNFGFNSASAASVISLTAALGLLTAAWELPTIWWMHRKSEQRLFLRVYPAVIPVSILCVLASRVFHIAPGFLIGAVGAAAVASGEATHEQEAKGVLACSLGVLLATAMAWMLWIPIDAHLGAIKHPGFVMALLDSMLATIVVSGLQMLVFGLLPLHFVKGEPLKKWSFLAWSGLFGTAVFGVLWLVVHPTGGLSDNIIPSVKTLAPFVGIAVAAAGVWAYFRYRRAPTLA